MKMNRLRATVFSLVFLVSSASWAGSGNDLLALGVQNNSLQSVRAAMVLGVDVDAFRTQFLEAWENNRWGVLATMVAHATADQLTILTDREQVFSAQPRQYQAELRHLRVLQNFAGQPAYRRQTYADGLINAPVPDHRLLYDLMIWVHNEQNGVDAGHVPSACDCVAVDY